MICVFFLASFALLLMLFLSRWIIRLCKFRTCWKFMSYFVVIYVCIIWVTRCWAWLSVQNDCANDLHMVQLRPLPPHYILLLYNLDWFNLSGTALPRSSWKRGRWMGVCLCVYNVCCSLYFNWIFYQLLMLCKTNYLEDTRKIL